MYNTPIFPSTSPLVLRTASFFNSPSHCVCVPLSRIAPEARAVEVQATQPRKYMPYSGGSTVVLSAQARVTTKQFQFRNFSVSLKACGRSPSNSHSARALLRRVRAPRVTAPGSGQSPKSDGGTHSSHAVPMLSVVSFVPVVRQWPLEWPGSAAPSLYRGGLTWWYHRLFAPLPTTTHDQCSSSRDPGC